MFVIVGFSSVRRVITCDQRLTELSLHISNTFLNILQVPNKAVFCITPTLNIELLLSNIELLLLLLLF